MSNRSYSFSMFPASPIPSCLEVLGLKAPPIFLYCAAVTSEARRYNYSTHFPGDRYRPPYAAAPRLFHITAVNSTISHLHSTALRSIRNYTTRSACIPRISLCQRPDLHSGKTTISRMCRHHGRRNGLQAYSRRNRSFHAAWIRPSDQLLLPSQSSRVDL